MREVTNRNWKSTEGILNWLRHRLGAKTMCRIKKVLGTIAGIKTKKINKQYLKRLVSENSQLENNVQWSSRFLKLIKSTNDEFMMEMIDEFYKSDITCIKQIDCAVKDSLTVVCVEKNELIRMKSFIQHYRQMGVKQFLICDNGSEDGTLEFLKEQEDVQLYFTVKRYNSQMKAAWCNRMMADWGDDKWYLVVDADEFAWTPELQRMDIKRYVNELKQKGIYAVKAVMLEMYPDAVLGKGLSNPEEFVKEYCYYDRDSDFYEYNPDNAIIKGGFVNRVFEEKNALQCKIPLFYMTKDRFTIGSHHIFPYYEDITSQYGMVLKHYKFIPGDEKRVKEAIEKKNYANGSRLYKKFVCIYDGEGINAYCDDSVKWQEETVTEHLPFIKEIIG